MQVTATVRTMIYNRGRRAWTAKLDVLITENGTATHHIGESIAKKHPVVYLNNKLVKWEADFQSDGNKIHHAINEAWNQHVLAEHYGKQEFKS